MVGCRLFASKIRYPEFMHDALAGALYVMNIDLASQELRKLGVTGD
ncbi:hypothetical protein [Streptomyces javensis]|uniref:Uncharacterized protein n=1 Tax=Streptomyces javensis TaxID=114698 RepID=A0ABS0RAF3_9ACTN|nr:hypothetical protein [Streptomyces javensis]MBI0314065.1 hypothetical protein [Streptomyces javensis]